MSYASVVFNFDVCEEGGVAEVGLATGTDVISVVGLISASSASTTLLKGMLETSGEHDDNNNYKVHDGAFKFVVAMRNKMGMDEMMDKDLESASKDGIDGLVQCKGYIHLS